MLVLSNLFDPLFSSYAACGSATLSVRRTACGVWHTAHGTRRAPCAVQNMQLGILLLITDMGVVGTGDVSHGYCWRVMHTAVLIDTVYIIDALYMMDTPWLGQSFRWLDFWLMIDNCQVGHIFGTAVAHAYFGRRCAVCLRECFWLRRSPCERLRAVRATAIETLVVIFTVFYACRFPPSLHFLLVN